MQTIALALTILLAACITPTETSPHAEEAQGGGGRILERFPDELRVTIPALRDGFQVLVEAPGGVLLADAGIPVVMDDVEGVPLRFVATGIDEAHVAGCRQVMDGGRVEVLYHPGTGTRQGTWGECLEAAQDTPRLGNPELDAGSPIRIDAATYATILYIDDQVLALRIDYGATSIVLAGSLDCRHEEAILDSGIDVEADLLQVGPDGACRSWLEATRPQSVFYQTPPRSEALDVLNELGIRVHAAHRDLVFRSDGRILHGP